MPIQGNRPGGVGAGQSSTPFSLDGRISKSRVELEQLVLTLDDTKFIKTPASSIKSAFYLYPASFQKRIGGSDPFPWPSTAARQTREPTLQQPRPALLGPAVWGLSSHHRCRAWPIGQKWGFWAQSRGGTEGWGVDSPHTLEPKAAARTLEPRWGTSWSMQCAPRLACPSLRPSAPHRRPLRSEPPV